MPGTDPSPDLVRSLFAEGAGAFVAFARRAGAAEAWDRPACGVWSVADVVRHELDVSGWYHAWLDRALAGDPTATFTVDQLDAEADAGVRRLAGTAPADAAEQFVREAARYLDRITSCWHLPYGYPRGTVTVGLHAGVAATEWHLHAWDVAGALGLDHRPSDPGALWVVTSACLTTATGGDPPPPSDEDPWLRILQRSGRTPR